MADCHSEAAQSVTTSPAISWGAGNLLEMFWWVHGNTTKKRARPTWAARQVPCHAWRTVTGLTTWQDASSKLQDEPGGRLMKVKPASCASYNATGLPCSIACCWCPPRSDTRLSAHLVPVSRTGFSQLCCPQAGWRSQLSATHNKQCSPPCQALVLPGMHSMSTKLEGQLGPSSLLAEDLSLVLFLLCVLLLSPADDRGCSWHVSRVKLHVHCHAALVDKSPDVPPPPHTMTPALTCDNACWACPAGCPPFRVFFGFALKLLKPLLSLLPLCSLCCMPRLLSLQGRECFCSTCVSTCVAWCEHTAVKCCSADRARFLLWTLQTQVEGLLELHT